MKIKLEAMFDFPDDVPVKAAEEAIRHLLTLPLGPEDCGLIRGAAYAIDTTLIDTTPRCSCCGTTENLHRDLGSGGPYRCNSADCVVV